MGFWGFGVSQQPQALQLRYLQTLVDMSNNGKSSTIVFPLPMDLIKPIMDAIGQNVAPARQVS